MDKKIDQKGGKYFTDAEKHQLIEELISTQCTKGDNLEKTYRQRRPWRSAQMDATLRLFYRL